MIIMKWEKDGSMEKDWLALQDIKQNQPSPAFDIIIFVRMHSFPQFKALH